MKLKSLLAEALTPLDKKAVQNFFDGKPFESKNLNSDGKTLKTVGIGSQPMYTHTPNGVKMVGKVTGGYSQSLVKYVNFMYKEDIVEARIPNNSTSVGEKIQKLVEKKSIKEAAGIDAMGIAGFTGTRGDAVQKFIDDNNLDGRKLFLYIKGGRLKERMGFVSAIAGTPNNKIQKELIAKFAKK